MICIEKDIFKTKTPFAHNCIFHPTNAVEDSWGRRILDRMSRDRAVETVRIYTMMEDIVYLDDQGRLAYDFRLTDLRLDYLLSKGFDILLAYAAMPDCIASLPPEKACYDFAKKRYKGNHLNVSMPRDMALWEEICYTYTRHIIDRYGIDTVKKWHLHCWNEPTCAGFFLAHLPPAEIEERIRQYGLLYESFAKGVKRASVETHIGGPALVHHDRCLKIFLDFVKEKGLPLDYVSLHNYARTAPVLLNDGSKSISVDNWIRMQQDYQDVIRECGFGDIEVVIDEWGLSSHATATVDECPPLAARDTEQFASYYAQLISRVTEKGWNLHKLMICLSGQENLTRDFLGCRNFFTKNMIPKPIYSAHMLASRLKAGIVAARCDRENIHITATKDDQGQYDILLCYGNATLDGDLPPVNETLHFEEDLRGRKATVYLIDREHTNPYRLYEKAGKPDPDEQMLAALRKEGTLKPYREFTVSEDIPLPLTANSVWLIEIQ